MTLTESTAANIVHVYNNLASAQVFSRALTNEPIVPETVKPVFRNISASCGNAMDRIRNKIPKEDRKFFDEQVTNNDPLKFAQIMSIYARLQPSAQERFERIGEALIKGELEFVETI